MLWRLEASIGASGLGFLILGYRTCKQYHRFGELVFFVVTMLAVLVLEFDWLRSVFNEQEFTLVILACLSSVGVWRGTKHFISLELGSKQPPSEKEISALVSDVINQDISYGCLIPFLLIVIESIRAKDALLHVYGYNTICVLVVTVYLIELALHKDNWLGYAHHTFTILSTIILVDFSNTSLEYNLTAVYTAYVFFEVFIYRSHFQYQNMKIRERQSSVVGSEVMQSVLNASKWCILTQPITIGLRIIASYILVFYSFSDAKQEDKIWKIVGFALSDLIWTLTQGLSEMKSLVHYAKFKQKCRFYQFEKDSKFDGFFNVVYKVINLLYRHRFSSLWDHGNERAEGLIQSAYEGNQKKVRTHANTNGKKSNTSRKNSIEKGAQVVESQANPPRKLTLEKGEVESEEDKAQIISSEKDVYLDRKYDNLT